MVIVKTKYGKIKGNQESNLQSFLGIPYAKPPIGDLRFREPQSLDKWDEIKDATKFGPIAHQNHKDTPPINQIESEDCLYLNIWTPNADEKSRPVMFYIHGGGFLNGAGSRQRLNGTRLASYGDVVVVTFNYRLGALGFLDLPNIPPNIGTQDQVAALKWVSENIHEFGGDPNNITIFGESSGGESVVILLINPSTRGLFHRAIMQSGVANPISYKKELTGKGAKEFISKLKIEEENIEALQKIQIDRFMRFQKKVAGIITDGKQNPFRPFVDGEIIPETPYECIRKGDYNKVPLILGWNEDELGIMSSFFNQADDNRREVILGIVKNMILNHGLKEDGLEKLIEAYKPVMKLKHPDNENKYWDAILSDSMFGIPTIRELETHLIHQTDVYCYIFTYGSTKYGGAYHSFECSFVFGTVDAAVLPEGAIDSFDDAQLVSKTMMDTWLCFARKGDPNHKGIPEWEPYNLQNRSTMMLGLKSELKNDPNSILRNAWDDVI